MLVNIVAVLILAAGIGFVLIFGKAVIDSLIDYFF